MALAIIGVGIGMMACMSGWNAAAHRKDQRTASLMSILFYLCTASLLGALVKFLFFGG